MNRSAPNLRHLRAFRAVARLQSISRAAREVHLSQPAITQAVAKLEKSLGLELFDRRSEGVFLTEAGRLFLDRVERMLRHLRTGTAEALRAAGRRGPRAAEGLDQRLTGVQLRALIAISEARNFTLAARKVGVSQPSLHRAARELEHLAGAVLFEKASRGIVLTRPAEILALHARLALVELEQGYDELEELKGADSGRLVIGSLPLARSFLLPTAIGALTRERPESRISVLEGPYETLLGSLRRGDIDVLIGALRDPVPIEDVTQEPLFRDPLAVVARAGHPLAQRPRLTLAELAEWGWVVPRRGAPTREYFEQLFAEAGCARPRSVVETGSLILVRGLLSASDRLTVISLHQIRHEMHSGLLAPLPFTLEGSERPIGLTIRRDWRPTPLQARFLDLVRDIGRVINAT